MLSVIMHSAGRDDLHDRRLDRGEKKNSTGGGGMGKPSSRDSSGTIKGLFDTETLAPRKNRASSAIHLVRRKKNAA